MPSKIQDKSNVHGYPAQVLLMVISENFVDSFQARSPFPQSVCQCVQTYHDNENDDEKVEAFRSEISYLPFLCRQFYKHKKFENLRTGYSLGHPIPVFWT
jgi:hypothetical protein